MSNSSADPHPDSEPTEHIETTPKKSSSQTEDPTDIFAAALNLEDTSYAEGYNLGFQDGTQAGLIEGRTFGLQKGFEKFLEMGKLHGKARVWGARLPLGSSATVESLAKESGGQTSEGHETMDTGTAREVKQGLQLSNNPRLEKHIKTLFALTEPESLSTENEEEAVSEFDDRYKRAVAKTKVIEKIIGEEPYVVPVEEQKDSIASRAGDPAAGIRLANIPNAERNIEDFIATGRARP